MREIGRSELIDRIRIKSDAEGCTAYCPFCNRTEQAPREEGTSPHSAVISKMLCHIRQIHEVTLIDN